MLPPAATLKPLQVIARELEGDNAPCQCRFDKLYVDADDTVCAINYPVERYPEKVKSIGFDKQAEIEGHLAGIKGQYLIFDDNRVLNIRKHNGYRISLM